MLTHDGKSRRAKVLDFGLAKATREERVDGGLTMEGQALGTPDYIAPEQILKAPDVDIRADIYSLGGTLYYLLTGHPPFEASSLYDIYQAHISRDADPLNFVRPEVPVELAALVAKMTAKDPARRFQTPREVAETLKPFFKRANAAYTSPSPEVSQAGQATAGRPVTGALSTPTQPTTGSGEPVVRAKELAVETVPETEWKSLIDFREADGGAHAPASATNARPGRPRWFRPSVATAAGFAAILFGTIIHITIERNRVTVEVRKGETPSKATGDTGGLPIDDARRRDRAPVAPSDSPPKQVKNSVGMTLVFIPSGEFEMGCPDGRKNENEKPPHLVRISRPFYLGACEVTQEQYQTLMEKNPSRFSGRPNNPVEMVSWIDAVTFCNKLSERETLQPYYRIVGVDKVTVLGGNGYRLPTEAEWEYACRAGDPSNFPFRDAGQLGRFAWMHNNCGGMTHPVGEKEPNSLGLHDMYGNVWEWCWDRLGDYPSSLSIDPNGPEIGTRRILRGQGWWNGSLFDCRPSYRFCTWPENSNYDFGFRIAAGYTAGLSADNARRPSR